MKMKLVCLLLSFALMNVSAAADDYLNLVETTNILIEWLCADNSMWRVILRLVSNIDPRNTMKKMVLMIALPELSLPNYSIERLTRLQTKMRDELQLVIGGSLNVVQFQATGRKSLAELGIARRAKTKPALRNHIISILLRQREPNVDFFQTCRIIGLFMSTKFTTAYIKRIKVLYDNTCVLRAVDQTTKTYKKFGREIHQVNNENHDIRIDNLINQLQ